MIIGKLYKKAEKVLRLRDMENAPDTDATITIRLLTKGERREALEEQFDVIAGEKEIHVHGLRSVNYVFRKCVKDWSGFYEDENKKHPFLCTPANKEKLISLSPEIVSFVAEAHGMLVKETEAAQEEATKNL